MQGALTVECACGVKVGLVSIQTGDLTIAGAWEGKRVLVRQLLLAHRQGHCSVYNPTVAPNVVHLRTPRFGRRLKRIIPE